MCVCVRKRGKEEEREREREREREQALHNTDTWLYLIKKLKSELSITVSMNALQ